MSRDYRLVDETPKGKRFRNPGPTFNVNVWGVEFYGRIFKALGLPLQKHNRLWPFQTPEFAHEYSRADMDKVKAEMQKPDFYTRLTEAIAETSVAMEYSGDMSPIEIADDMLKEFFPPFTDPTAFSLASDYCEQYYDHETPEQI